MPVTPKVAAIMCGLAISVSGTASAAWQPVKPIEFIATAGPGGGTDNFARAVQSIITKHKLIDRMASSPTRGVAAVPRAIPTPRRWRAILTR